MLKKNIFYGMMWLSAAALLYGCGKDKASSEDTGQQLSIVTMEPESNSGDIEKEEQESVSESAAPVESDESNDEEEDSSQEQVAESTDSGSDVVAKFECEEMGFTIQISNELEETMGKLKYEYQAKQENDLFQTSCDSCEFYVMFGKTKQVMFSVYRLPEEYTIEDFSRLDCDIQILGYSSANETYVLQFPLEPKEELSDQEKQEFNSMLNDTLRNISPFIMLES